MNASQKSNLTAALNKIGITPPEPAPVAPFPKPRATIDDVSTAIMASKSANPYADVKVQAAVIEYQAAKIHGLSDHYYEVERGKQFDDFMTHFDELEAKIHHTFTEAAGRLEQTAPLVGGLADPADINLRTAAPGQVEAATTAIQAIKTLEDTLKAWQHLHIVHGHQFGNDASRSFAYSVPTPEQWNTFRNDPSVWKAAQQGIALDLAQTPTEAAARQRALANKYDELQADNDHRMSTGNYR